MKISDFELYRDLLQRNSGLSLTADKSYLLDSRLTPVARKWGYPTLEAMTLALRGVPDHNLLSDVVEAMTTPDTGFFRDMPVFTNLRDHVIPHVMKERGRKKQMRIWCAGCATGQEAYSIAILLKDMEKKLKGWKIEILGTDISTEALRKARTGTYTQFEVQRGLPVNYLVTYFEEKGDSWQLSEDVRLLAHFEQFNLLEPMDDLGVFDIIICRNVLSTFERGTKTQVLGRLADQLSENGFLVLGADESLNGFETPFRKLGDCLYGFEDGQYALAAPKTAVS